MLRIILSGVQLPTFIGVAELQAGRAYFFGANHGLTFIANPSGGTGNGIGSFFEIQLIKN